MNDDTLITELLNAYDTARLIELPSNRITGFSINDAYRIGARLTSLRRERGEQTAGRKLGFTNAGLWAQYNVDRPLWAHIYEDGVYFANDGLAEISLRGTLQPRMEPEIVLAVRGPIPPDAQSDEEILRYVEWMALGFELVDCHYADWRFTFADGVADFGLHRGLVVGEPCPVTARMIPQLAEQLRSFRLTLSSDGEQLAEGSGANVLGSPARALAFLRDTLAAQPDSEPLAPGEVITTGTVTPAFAVRPGLTWVSEVNGIDLGRLEVQIVG
jgi:2-oxo-3-hexenedioate decarboxylase